MTTTATARPSLATKTQAELIYEQQERIRRAFRFKVVISWVVLLGLLVFMFSGTEVAIGPFTIRTLRLDPEFARTWAPFISGGIWQTIMISALSIVLATVLAILAALGRLSRISPIYALSVFYVSLIRGTPLFLQVIFFFLALPQIGIRLPGLWAGVLALGINYGAYMSEIFRSGLEAVGTGQREAATALGMTPGQTMRRIMLPQAFRIAIPPTGNEFIAMLKDSALVSATGFVHEILWRAQKVGRANFRSLEALLIAAAFYWVMTLAFTAMQARIEAHMARGDR